MFDSKGTGSPQRPDDGVGGRMRLVRAMTLAMTALLLANCAGQQFATGGRHASELKYGVKSSPRVIPEGQPIPKGGGRDMVGKPYVVAGRTYVPHEGRGYVREGWASWYGSDFHGRLTANGEIFDRQSIAAAHPTLPLPSYVRVTNLVNGRSLIVRVNDRGPYEQGRLIDVSERAAEALDFRRKGTTRVRVDYVGKASVEGSDDEKLLATLRTGTEPEGRGRVQLARMQESERPAPRRRSEDDEEKPLQRRGLPDVAEAPRQPMPPRRSVASAGEPVDLMPPRRSELGPLY